MQGLTRKTNPIIESNGLFIFPLGRFKNSQCKDKKEEYLQLLHALQLIEYLYQLIFYSAHINTTKLCPDSQEIATAMDL